MKWPAKLTGTHPLAPWLNDLLESAKSCQIKPAAGYKISSQSGSGTILEIPKQSAFSGWRWASPIEGSVRAYSKGEVLHLQPTNTLVTTGIRDAANPTGAVVKSKAGRWVALQDVPDKTTVSGNDVWHLPQWPMPEPTDYDDTTNYWAFFPDPVCV